LRGKQREDQLEGQQQQLLLLFSALYTVLYIMRRAHVPETLWIGWTKEAHFGWCRRWKYESALVRTQYV